LPTDRRDFLAGFLLVNAGFDNIRKIAEHMNQAGYFFAGMRVNITADMRQKYQD